MNDSETANLLRNLFAEALAFYAVIFIRHALSEARIRSNTSFTNELHNRIFSLNRLIYGLA